jgi:hypothetical protein
MNIPGYIHTWIHTSLSTSNHNDPSGWFVAYILSRRENFGVNGLKRMKQVSKQNKTREFEYCFDASSCVR